MNRRAYLQSALPSERNMEDVLYFTAVLGTSVVEGIPKPIPPAPRPKPDRAALAHDARGCRALEQDLCRPQ